MTRSGRDEHRRGANAPGIAILAAGTFLLVAATARAQPLVATPRANSPEPRFLVKQLSATGRPGDVELSSGIRLDEIDAVAQNRLAAIAAYLADEQWPEAIEALEGLARDFGAKVIEVSPGRYVSVREYFHRRIAALPAEALHIYRGPVDDVAHQWLLQGISTRDPAPLVRLLHQFFCSSWGDDALTALGEMSLERGEYGAARSYWEAIHPALRAPDGRSMWLAAADLNWDATATQVVDILADAKGPSTELVFPDSDLDLAGIRARLVLTSILEGALRRAEMELDILRGLHPSASGRIAGREVDYAEFLAAMLAEARRAEPAAEPQIAGGDWTTFGGSPARTGRAAQAGVVGASSWKKPISLPPPPQANFAMSQSYGLPGVRVAEDFNAPFCYYPFVAGDLLLVGHSAAIYAFDLATGEPAWGQSGGAIFESDRFNPPPRRTIQEGLGVPRYLLTIDGSRLFARVGDPITAQPPDAEAEEDAGELICLDLAGGGRLAWKTAPDKPGWSFDGAPVAAGDRLYIAMRKSDVRPQAYVACLDATTGAILWRVFICAAETPSRGQVGEVTSNLLTLADETLYFNTNMGAVAAVSAEDGRILWITTYPRSTAGDGESSDYRNRDLVPCIVDRGLVITAPADYPEIFALEASTGRLAWSCPAATDAVHLVGIYGSSVLASGRHLSWIDVDTGRAIRRWPDSDDSGEVGFGRPALAGGEVFWPTRALVRVFDAQTGRQTREPLRLDALGARTGNLVIAGGRLLIASSDRVYGFLLSDEHQHEE